MKLLIVALAVVLVADIVSVQAQEEEEEEEGYDGSPEGWIGYPGGPRWGPWRRHWDADRYKLSVTVSDENVEQYVVKRNFWKSVLVKSWGGDTETTEIGRSHSVYDLSCDNGIVIILIEGFPCFVANTTLTWETAQDFLKTNHGCKVAAGPKVSLDARRQPLNVEEIKKLDQSYRSVLHFCPLRPIVLATPIDSASTFPDNSTDVINIVSLNIPYSIGVL